MNFVSIRQLKQKPNSNQLNHDLYNSHKRKINDKKNKLFFDGNEIEIERDVTRENKKEYKEIDYFFTDLKEKVKKDYTKHHPRALKSNTQLIWNGIITLGNEKSTLTREEVDKIDKKELEKCFISAYENICKEQGVNPKNGYLVMHYDETQIHAHYSILGYDFKEHRVIAKQTNREKLSSLQDVAGESFKSIGFKRGIKKFDRLNQESQNTFKKDYKDLNINEKREINKNANVTNKSAKMLNEELKTIVNEREIALNELMGFDVDIEKLERMPKSNDKVINRIITYSKRLLNDKANKEKTIKNLEKNIDKLSDKEKLLKSLEKDDIEIKDVKTFNKNLRRPARKLAKNIQYHNEWFGNQINKITMPIQDLDKIDSYLVKQNQKILYLKNQLQEVEPILEYKTTLKDLLAKNKLKESLESDIIKLRQTKSELHSKIIISKKQLLEIEQKEKNIEDKIEEKEMLNKKITNLEKENENFLNETQDLKKENNEIKEQNIFLLNENKDLKQKIREIQKEKEKDYSIAL